MHDFFYTTEPFAPYGMAYFTSIATLFAIGVILIRLGKRGNQDRNQRILKVTASTLSLIIMSWVVIEISLDRFDIKNDLPLIFCNLIALLLPIYTWSRKKWLFDLLYYLILAGAIQSVITPALKQNYPHYEAFKFWIVHGGLIIFILFEVIKGNRRPSLKGVFTTFLFVQLYLLLVIAVNYLLDSNYLFLRAKPTNTSLLDLLGDWPYYLIYMDLLLVPYFLLLYLPMVLANKMKTTN